VAPNGFIHPSKLYRLYFDETGNGDLGAAKNNPNERYLSLTGIVIRQDFHDKYTTKRLNRLKQDIWGPGGDKIVLHRRCIMKREREFSVFNNPFIRKEFDTRIASLIAEVPDLGFTVSIDKKEHLEKYSVWRFSPYHYVMTCLAERFVLWLHRTNNYGDILGEARNPTHDAALKRAFAQFYERGTSLKSDVIQKRLVSKELTLRIKEANIAGLQMADILAHPCHRAMKFAREKQEAPDDYGTLLSTIMHNRIYDRDKKTGDVRGYGCKWLP